MFFLCCSQIQSGYKVQKGAQNESNITNVVPIGSVDQWHHSIHCILQADHTAIHTYSKAYVCMHGSVVEHIQSHLLKLSDAAPNMATSFTPAFIYTIVQYTHMNDTQYSS